MTEPPNSESDLSKRDAIGATVGRRLRNGLIAIAAFGAMVVGLVLAIPGLHGVEHAVIHMNGAWIVAAVALEVLSCFGYVLAFIQVFRRTPIGFATKVALAEQGFGAAVPLAGAGSLVLGGWLLVERGEPIVSVAKRSAVLYLLTSAINLITLVVISLGLLSGILAGPRDLELSLIPAAAGTAVFLFFLLLPRFVKRIARLKSMPRPIRLFLIAAADSIHDTKALVLSGDWRLIGAIGYLWFDISVLIVCFAALGHVPPIAAIVLGYQLGYLINVVPIPGGIGVLDAGIIGLLVLYGVHATPAAAATLVYHAIALWIPGLLGLTAFLILRRARRKLGRELLD